LQAAEEVKYQNTDYVLDFIPAKHKFVINEIPEGGDIIMYGVLVGHAQSNIKAGGLLSTAQ
jgi:altronate hydrolase